jgi:broad-specificity NMP kinase
MNKSVLITGVAGSGKSYICAELSRLGYMSFDIEEIDGLFSYIDKKTKDEVKDIGGQDLRTIKRHDWVCVRERLEHLMRRNSKASAKDGVVFYCGASSNLIELLPLFDKVILLVASEAVARLRLTTRTNKEFGKRKDVRDWVMSWKKWWEDQYVGKGAIVIDAGQPAAEIVTCILREVNL